MSWWRMYDEKSLGRTLHFLYHYCGFDMAESATCSREVVHLHGNLVANITDQQEVELEGIKVVVPVFNFIDEDHTRRQKYFQRKAIIDLKEFREIFLRTNGYDLGAYRKLSYLENCEATEKYNASLVEDQELINYRTYLQTVHKAWECFENGDNVGGYRNLKVLESGIKSRLAVLEFLSIPLSSMPETPMTQEDIEKQIKIVADCPEVSETDEEFMKDCSGL